MTIEPEPNPRAPPEATARMTSVGLAAAIDQFADPELLGEGKVNLIALDAIVERLGDRWAQRRDQIHDHVDRTLQRRLGGQGYHLRVSETDFLICQPELGRFTGQAACLQALREILTFFIGEAAQADNCVHQVTKLSAHAIEGWRVRASDVEEGEQAERQASAFPQPGSPTVDRWTPFVASDGRELGVTCSLEPVIELKTFGRIGYRIVGCVQVAETAEVLTAKAIRRLSGADVLRIDLATIARGMEQLRRTAGDLPQPSIIVPVSFTTLSSQRGRAEVSRLLLEARGLVERGVICEIRDVVGVPPGVMLANLSLVRPYCLFIMAHVDSGWSPATSSQLKRSGVQALSTECPQGFSDAAFIRWTKATIEATRRVARSTLLYRVASPGHAILASELGASHASVREQA